MEIKSTLPVIDLELGAKLVGNQPAIAKEMLGMFLKTLPDECSSIKHLYANNDYLSLKQRIHKIHGALCYCGAPRLKTVISSLESHLKNNILDLLPKLFKQLDDEVNLLIESFSRLTLTNSTTNAAFNSKNSFAEQNS